MDGEGEDGGIAGENGGGAVAVVIVTVHHHGARDFAFALQLPDTHGDVVNGAKTFAVIRKRVMESAADVVSDALLKGQVRG